MQLSTDPVHRSTALLMVTVLVAGCDRSDKFRVELASPGDSAFTTAPGENRIRLRARLPSDLGSAQVTWHVIRLLGDSSTSVNVPPGKETAIIVSQTGTERYRGDHPTTSALRSARLKKLRIRYLISAEAGSGRRTVPSDTLLVEQAMLATIRQEYIDLGLRRGAPPLVWFTELQKLPAGLTYGDFDVAVANPEFMTKLDQLEKTWKDDYGLTWKLNGLFRNPVHNRFHVKGGGSGPVSNSWHQFGCAADLQTYPVLTGGRASAADSARARDFWDALSQEALELDFQVEPRDKNPARPSAAYSGVGHVHLETDCVQ
jgi:hypothetical protein